MPAVSSTQSIPQINISQGTGNSFDAGKFGNAFIKALNIDIGISENPTSINIGLIRPVGRLGYIDHKLSYQDPYRLSLGGQVDIWCYLIGQKKSTGSDSITTQLELVDGSHILDRIFVGGIGVHINPSDPAFSKTQILDESVPVICPDCYSQQIISVPDPKKQIIVTATNMLKVTDPYPVGNQIPVHPMFTQRLSRQSTLNGIGNLQQGGYIFLGDEKYTKTSCELAEVDYSFQSLIDACAKMGINIKIPDLSVAKAPSGQRVSFLRKSHWGTLRSVLNSWCTDFGISFVYDYTQLTPTILPIDLGVATRSQLINDIAATAKLIKSANTSLVQSIEENRTLKGSFRNSVITSYKRARTKREFSKTTFYGTFYKAFQIHDLIGLAARSHRTIRQFNTSCMIGKYDTSIRVLYNTYLGIKNMLNGNFTGGSKVFRCLGFNAAFNIDEPTKNEIIDECLDTETYREIVTKWGDNFHMILGTYSEEFAKKMEDFEVNYANEVMGKWFFTNLDSYADAKYGGFQRCFTGTDWRYEIESSMTPSPHETSTSQENSSQTDAQNSLMAQSKLPFAKYLWGPLPGDYNPWTLGFSRNPRLKVLNRSDAPWATNQEGVEDVFKQKTDDGVIDLASPYIPVFQNIEGLIETRLRARYQGTNVPIGQAITGIKAKSVPCLMMCPGPDVLSSVLQVQPLGPQINPNETPYYFTKGSAQGNKADCDESLRCEIQASLDSKVCDPKRLCSNYPQLGPSSANLGSYYGKIYGAQDGEPFNEGVLNFLGEGLLIRFAPPGVTDVDGRPYAPSPLFIVAPAGTAGNGINDIYLANYQEKIKSTYYDRKIEEFRGNYNLAGNTSEIQLTLNDVSSDDSLGLYRDPFTGNVGVITNIYIRGEGFLTLDQYHNYIQSLSNLGTDEPVKQDVTVNFGNLDFGPLTQFLSPINGLNKLSCAVDSNGINATAGWSTRTAKAPSQDLFTQKIVPQLWSSRNLMR